MRTEVGYGLEAVLPDGLSGQIIRTDFLPQFKSGDYTHGIMQGTRHASTSCSGTTRCRRRNAKR
jgi:uncharacterized protein